MPNHCYNILTLESGESLFDVLSPYLIDKEELFDFDFQKIVPMDEKMLEGEKWYTWRLQNWGTKWTGYDGRFNCDDLSSFIFDTAWSPPLPIIKKLAELTEKTFILEYIEEGNFFCGRYTVGVDGEKDEYYNNITDAPSELLDSLGYEPWEEEVV